MSTVTDDRRFGRPPTRSFAQQMDALAKGNAVRAARAGLKRDLKAGRVSLFDVLAEPPEYAATMKVYDVLLAAPKLGRVKVEKVLRAAGVSPSKTLGGLTARQRGEIASRCA
jgi:hypothetical protein